MAFYVLMCRQETRLFTHSLTHLVNLCYQILYCQFG